MNLLNEIQNNVVDSEKDLGTILRKCKLLSARLDNKSFQEWLIWESDGYPQNVSVPDYRVWTLTVKGHFSGWGGAGIQFAPIPLAVIPTKVRGFYQRYQCKQSAASIEATLKSSEKGGTMHIDTGDLALMLGDKVYRGQNCIQAWAECSEGHLVEVLNSVRNRVLDFTLAIAKEAPGLGNEVQGSDSGIKNERVSQIFNTIVYGGAANLVGSAHQSNVHFQIGIKDFDSLQRLLEEKGVQPAELVELKSALESEDLKNPEAGFGPKVSAWIAKMMQKAADGSWKIGLGAGGNLLARAIAKYYGFE